MKRRIISILLSLGIIATILPAALADTVPIVIPDLIITNNDGIITAEYSGDKGGAGDLLILAEYGLSGALKSMQTTAAVKGSNLSIEKKNGRIYKAFAMNLNTMVPLCESAFYGEDAYTGSVEVPYIEGAVAEATTTAIREYNASSNTIKITSDTAYVNANLIIAQYTSGGALVNVSIDEIDIEAQKAYKKDYTANNSYVTKYMLWDGLTTLEPLAECE